MDEGESKTCDNCKREIPAVNFTTHTVFCARNIRVCPVCKEPVPQAELQDHHEKMHKLLPCKQCGESVCGTDLEDHIRDSCAHTMKSCRFCALELRRGSLPAHERYCGARTEQCSDCGEWVMHKYRQLHLDSNHGFLRLDDDPVPVKKDDKTTNVPKPLNLPKPSPFSDPIKAARVLQPLNGLTNINNNAKPLTEIRNLPSSSASSNFGNVFKNSPSTSRSEINGPSVAGPSSTSRPNSSIAHNLANINRPRSINPSPLSDRTNQPSNMISPSASDAANTSSSAHNGAIPRVKRTNDQPQVNTPVPAPDKVQKCLWLPRGAVKKRPAPQPPTKEPPPDPKRDLPLSSALQRQQEEERLRQEQTAYNLSVGLPPVLSAAAKLDKLRKMDALQNRPEVDEQDYKNRLQGRVWMSPEIVPVGHVLGTSSNNGTKISRELEASRRSSSSRSPEIAQDDEVRRNDLKDLKPMTPEEFMDRFNELQLRKPGEETVRGDRFSQIKFSLRELRRGLNEVTAPYNLNANNESFLSGRGSPEGSPVHLPCEFCGAPVPSDDLVQHQTGCRPDLAQYRPTVFADNDEQNRRSSGPSPEPGVYIPCEFCTRPQPVYLLSEHQERCGREANMLFPD